MIANTNVGGENCHRGSMLGTIVGALHGMSGAFTQKQEKSYIQGLVAHEEIQKEITEFLDAILWKYRTKLRQLPCPFTCSIFSKKKKWFCSCESLMRNSWERALAVDEESSRVPVRSSFFSGGLRECVLTNMTDESAPVRRPHRCNPRLEDVIQVPFTHHYFSLSLSHTHTHTHTLWWFRSTTFASRLSSINSPTLPKP